MLQKLRARFRGGSERDAVAEENVRLEAELEKARRKLRRFEERLPYGALDPKRLVWIFGEPRTGSSWLARMLDDLGENTLWNEPLVGGLFGDFYFLRFPHRRGSKFVLGAPDSLRKNLIRNFVLTAAEAKFPDATERGLLVIKDPNGSVGAPLIMEALPESRMVFLVRDPRDVVASILDATGTGGWRHEELEKRKSEGRERTEGPDTTVAGRTKRYVTSIEKTREAYVSHAGPKALVRYEDLRAGALGEMNRMLSALGISIDEKELVHSVEKHAWENVPEERKGEGKFYRKAAPGGWREDLTPEQVRVVERVAAPLFEEFYPRSFTRG